MTPDPSQDADPLWEQVRQSARRQAEHEPVMADFLQAAVLGHERLENALALYLATRLDSPDFSRQALQATIEEAFLATPELQHAVRADLKAVVERDSACSDPLDPFLHFKGFHALQAYRVSNWLWRQGRSSLALFLQSRISTSFDVDIHPAAQLGQGIMLDHATGLVIGETAVIRNQVSIMQGVTLGGTGKESGDRHPKVEEGVLISSAATVLGNIRIGRGAKIGAGSVVLKDVPPHTTVAGVPAKVIGSTDTQAPALDMDHGLPDPPATDPGR